MARAVRKLWELRTPWRGGRDSGCAAGVARVRVVLATQPICVTVVAWVTRPRTRMRTRSGLPGDLHETNRRQTT